jgi:peptide/nickel transport system permease protein
VIDRWQVARRIGLALLSIYLVVSAAFLFVVLTPDPTVNQVRQGAAVSCTGNSEERQQCIEEKVSSYRESRNLDDPVLERYVNWLGDVLTFDWGLSFSTGLPVTDVIRTSLPYTLLYVVPAMALSAVGGVAVGAYLAMRRNSRLDRLGTALTYLGFGVPSFWLAVVLLVYATDTYVVADQYLVQWNAQVSAGRSPLAPMNLLAATLPTFVLATTLLAGQLRYARAETLDHLGEEFVRLVRAKGHGDRGVARHVLRVAAAPLVALFVVELFGVLLVNMFVIEYVFDVPGFGTLTYQAIKQRDLPLIVGATMVIATVGVVGNLLKDLLNAALDPRVGEEA